MNSGRKWLSFFTPNPRPRIESVCFSVILLFFGALGVLSIQILYQEFESSECYPGTAYNLDLRFPFQ